MRKPVSRVLVINDEPLVLREFVKGLNAAARSLDNPLGLTFTGVTTAREALAALEQDGDVQAVVVDDKLYTLNGKNSKQLQMSALELVQRITRFRPEVDVYILIAQEHEDEVVDTLFAEAVDGYFYREERDYRGMYRILNAQIQERARTPFYDQLKNYVWMAKDSWHTPGHSSGESLRGSPWINDFYDFMGEHIFDADLSVSVPMLDSLMEPNGVIAEAQAMAAKAFGARRTFFATNGTSTANKVIFQTLLAPGEKLLLDRNCHKSVHHGVVLSGAYPVYLNSSVNRTYGIYGPVPKKTILAAIEEHPDAEALILTSCTYDGLRYDLKPIIEAAHAHGIRVIIDEAWYGFARFHPEFRPTAIEAGADYATQSTHKVMSAFSQASMIHVNDPAFNEHLFRENFNMHTSTTPQYAMIASLDVARKQMMMEGYKLLSRTLALAQELRSQINSTGVFRVLELDELLPDEVKNDGVTPRPDQGDGGHLELRLHGRGPAAGALHPLQHPGREVDLQHADAAADDRHHAQQGVAALRRADADRARGPRAATPLPVPDIPEFTALRFLPRDAYYCGGEPLPILDDRDNVNKALVERVCADQIAPYPPGIPVLVPGQIVTREVVDYLAGLLRSQKRMEMHGIVHDGYIPCLRVLSVRGARAEERRLTPPGRPRVAQILGKMLKKESKRRQELSPNEAFALSS